MSVIAHGGALLTGFELAGASSMVALATTVRRGPRRIAAIAAGITLAVAAAPPLHDAADSSATAHMVQHLGLTVLAAPLIAVAFAGSSLQRSASVRRWTTRLVHPAPAPLAAGLAATVVMAVWHLPRAYDAAVDVWWIHASEHMMLIAATTWFWATALHHGVRRNPVAVIAALAGVATAGAAVGVLLMFTPTALYASQRNLADGQVAGALLTASGVVHGAAAFVLVVRALGRLRRPRPLSHATALSVSIVTAAVVAAIALQLQTDHSGVAATSTPYQSADAVRGAEMYRRDCVSCHGVSGEGTNRGIPIDDRGTASVYYALATGRMPIGDPDDTIERGEPHYSPDEIDQLVAYTATFVAGPEIPALVDDAALARGGELYRLNCAACHGATGIGGAQSFSRVAPSVLHASELETAAAIVAGPGGMPSFRSSLDDTEVSSVASYVGYLQDPVRRGISLQSGRIGEGLIAWVIGIGVLLAAGRWVARRP